MVLAEDDDVSVANYHLRSGWKLIETSAVRIPAKSG
jgi:hypothetical protein